MNKNIIKKLKVIGAGGFARELTEYIEQNNAVSDNKIFIEGYFDVDESSYTRYGFTAPYLGSEREYTFDTEDQVIIAVGDPTIRKRVAEFLQQKNVKITGFIHHTCNISSTSIIGEGNILCPFCIIGPNVTIGSLNLLNYRCAVPHDCSIGDVNVFSPNVHLTGFTSVGNYNLFGVSSGTVPNIKVGDNNKIQAGIILNKNIKNNQIVFTMPNIKTMELYK